MKKNEIDMLNGPLFSRIILFAIPLILSSLLQLLFNAADLVVVGKFAGSNSLAAVGATSSLINLLVNLFVGISMGCSVYLGRTIGETKLDRANRIVHTSIAMALICGVFMLIFGNVVCKPMLTIMGTPDGVINLSVLYMRIYFCGMPAFMLYNFGAALLRAIGDTKRPLYYLSLAGVVNVVFNLFLVVVCHMGVAGVAIATITSQYISAILVVLSLLHTDGYMRLELKKLCLENTIVKEIIRIGLPAGIQSVVFNISNVLIQSSVNSFGPIVLAGNTAAQNIEGFVYTSMNGIYQTCLSFTSQNYGAKNYKRINKILIECLLTVTVAGLFFGQGAYRLGTHLLGFYTSDPQVVQYGLNRLSVVSATYFICGLMDVICGTMRGIGYSIMPMIVSLVGACLFRIIWIFTVFRAYHTQFSLYVSYPISWILTFVAHLICYLIVRKKVFKHETI